MALQSRRLSSSKRKRLNSKQLRFRKRRIWRMRPRTQKRNLKKQKKFTKNDKLRRRRACRQGATVRIIKAILCQLLKKEGLSMLLRLVSYRRNKSSLMSSSISSYSIWEVRDSVVDWRLRYITISTSRRPIFQTSTFADLMSEANPLTTIIYTSKSYNNTQLHLSKHTLPMSQAPRSQALTWTTWLPNSSCSINSCRTIWVLLVVLGVAACCKLPHQATTLCKTMKRERFTISRKTSMAPATTSLSHQTMASQGPDLHSNMEVLLALGEVTLRSIYRLTVHSL